MRRIRIVTDNSMAFSESGRMAFDNHVTLPMQRSIMNSKPHPIIKPDSVDFPKIPYPDYCIKIVQPKEDDFYKVFQSKFNETNDFLVFSGTSHIPSIYTNANRVVECLHVQNSIHVVDTYTIHAGL
jgi:fatty acid-binding protein DegV